MRQDIILVANEGQTIPTILGDKVTKEFPNALGVAYIDGDKGLYVGSEKAGLALSDFEEHQGEFKGSGRVYQFAFSKGEVADEDLQPIPILTVDKEHVVVVFGEGRFPVTNDGQLTDTTILATTVLKDIIEDAWEISQHNVDKLSERMKGKTFMGEMGRLCEPFKSTLVFMLSNGHIHVHSKSETKAEAPWGFTSSMLGLKEGIFPAEAKEPAPAEKRKIGGIKPSTVPSVPSGSVAAAAIEKAVATEKKEDPPLPVYNQPEMVWAVPRTNDARKIHDWYHKNNNGMVPSNHMTKPWIQMPKEKALKQGNTEVKKDVTKEDAGKQPYRAFAEIPKEQVRVVEPAKPVEPEAPKELVPVYPVDKVNQVGALIQNNKQVMDPADWAKMEVNYPPFWKAHGIKTEDMFKWPLALRQKIAALDPLQAAHAWQNSDYQQKRLSEELLAQMEENEVLKKELATLKAAPAEQPVIEKKRIGGIRR